MDDNYVSLKIWDWTIILGDSHQLQSEAKVSSLNRESFLAKEIPRPYPFAHWLMPI